MTEPRYQRGWRYRRSGRRPWVKHTAARKFKVRVASRQHRPAMQQEDADSAAASRLKDDLLAPRAC